MYNFTWNIPTVIHFGKDQLSHLEELKESGNKVLMVYGGGSIKKIGIYDKAVELLKNVGLEIFELPGIEPNPRIESVRKGVELCKKNKIDMVLAIGGGSTIDASKVIAAGACYDGDAWDLVLDGSKIKNALPVYTILTLSATGSEMDPYAVISDLTKNEKWGTESQNVKPKMSVLDPTYTFSVSKKQTAAGTADIMSHTLENYFTTVKGNDFQKNMCEAILKTLVKYGPIAYNEPDNYDARANLMWCSSMAINGLVSLGSAVAWCIHPMEHELSAFYDITHGEGLAILTPVWMEYCMKKNPNTIADYANFGRNVFGIKENNDNICAEKSVAALRKYLFEDLHIPANLRAVGITEKVNFEKMAEKAEKGCKGCYEPLSKKDIMAIFEAAY